MIFYYQHHLVYVLVMMILRSFWWMIGVAVLLGSAGARAVEIDLALSTGLDHTRTILMQRYIQRIDERTNGQLKIRLHMGGSLHTGPQVPAALKSGRLDMGVPGLWQLGRYAPNALVFDLPMFFGKSRENIYEITDGPLGTQLIDDLETRLNVKVLGRFMDLGHSAIFTRNRPITRHQDLAGLRLRTLPGLAFIKRYQTLQTFPARFAITDVRQALRDDIVDGIQTTFESARSLQLWDTGIRFAYNDLQGFLQYVPMVSKTTWQTLTPQMQAIMIATWEEMIIPARDFAQQRQLESRKLMEDRGVRIIDAPSQERAATRTLLMTIQPGTIEELEIDPAFVLAVQATLAGQLPF